MSDRLEKVLAVLDVGLQSSTEGGFGTDHSPAACSRCQTHDIENGDLCAGCRAYLLEDTDHDPQNVQPKRIDHANGHPVIGGSIDGSCVAAQGRYLEVPILNHVSFRVDEDMDFTAPMFERDVYRREQFAVRDRLMWAWVHTSLSGHEAARRLADTTGC